MPESPIQERVPTVQELLVRHATAIRRMLERRSGPYVLKRTTVEDLNQETVAAALSGAGSFIYRDDAGFLVWIGTIVRRTIARQLGFQLQATRQVRICGEESSGPGVCGGSIRSGRRGPASSAAFHEGESALRRAVDALPDRYRQVVILYEIEGLPLAEVAAQLNRSKGATCRLLARARDALRSQLQD